MLDEDEGIQLLPSIEYCVLDSRGELEEDVVLQKKVRETRRGPQESWPIGLKGKTQSQARWYPKEQVRELFPHIFPH